jgi:hypothetical protein
VKTVALIGGAEETRGGHVQSSADEFWTLNWSYKYPWLEKPISRLFEMHPIWLYADADKEEWSKPKEHWEWRQDGEKGYPIYMLGDIPQIPSCVRYPIEDVSRYIFGERLIYDNEPHDFFTSSFDYMLALAIYEKWDVIELYGFEMGSVTEYRYQREGAAFFIGTAVAKGIKVTRPAKSVLLRARKYGYEGGQMIFRQDLERLHTYWAKKNKNAFAKLQHYEGMLHAMTDNGDDPDKIAETHQKFQELRDEAIGSSYSLQLLEYQIRHIDLEEPELQFNNPIEFIPVVN